MKKILLSLIITSSCASLMGMDKEHKQIIPMNDTVAEQVASMAHDRHERIPRDPEHIQLHAGMEQIEKNRRTSPDNTKNISSILGGMEQRENDPHDLKKCTSYIARCIALPFTIPIDILCCPCEKPFTYALDVRPCPFLLTNILYETTRN